MIEEIEGPILVLGAGGFIGANLFRALRSSREDVWGAVGSLNSWRLSDPPFGSVFLKADLRKDDKLKLVLESASPKTIFNCAAYGAYSWQEDAERMCETNFLLPSRILDWCEKNGARYIHAGSSSEYGTNSTCPSEIAPLMPNSPYAVSKAAASHLIWYYGKHNGVACCNLRLYSVYGPLEDASRLIPQVVINGAWGRYPPFVSPDVSRDFVYIDDVVQAFIAAAVKLTPKYYGEPFNIGTGFRTTIRDVSIRARSLFGIGDMPTYEMADRAWDRSHWYADPRKARKVLGYVGRTRFSDGLVKTDKWYTGLANKDAYVNSSVRNRDEKS